MPQAKKTTKKKASKKKGANQLQAPRGTRDLIGDDALAYQGFVEKAAEVALYYGFKPIEMPIIEHESVFEKGSGESSDIVEKEMYTLKTKGGDKLALRPEFTPGMMRSYVEHGMSSLPQPVMLYTAGPLFRHERPQKGRYRQHYQFDVEVLGSDKSVADALVIKLFTTIASEAGLENLSVHINSIGDKECRSSYRKELVNYYKKNLGNVCKDCHRRLSTNPLRLLDCKEEQCQPIKEEAPSSVSYLCEPCRKHFKEVLEYLEALDIPYTINNRLVRGLDYYTRTVFEVFAEVEQEPEEESDEEEGEKKEEKPKAAPLALGGGGRYDYLAKTLGHNKQIPAVGFGMGIDRMLEIVDKKKITPRIMKKPKVFFIQLGFEAKLKSMQVTEILRKAKIPVYHSMSKDSLGSQLGIAEKLGVPYTIILGQREVIDNTVIVRTMNNRSQKTVPIDDLANHLKGLK